MMTLDQFEQASEKVQNVILPTNLIYSEYYSAQTGGKIYLKPENMQYTGAYKVRGAYYKISTMSEEDRQKGLITASAGNHAQGVAYAAKLFGVKAVIVMPNTTPLIKVNRTKSYGAEVVLHGDVYDDACSYALQLAEEKGYTFIHPFDDEVVATGQGSIAMEIIKELPTVDMILAPVGGGGLLCGVSTLAKLLNPNIKVIGVEPAGANCMQESLKQGKVVSLPNVNTIADGTAVKTPGHNIFPYIQSGGNMDVITMSSVVQHGLIQRGRIFTVSVQLPDRPGELVRVADVIAKAQGNIIRLEHNQFVSINRIAAVELTITMEAFGNDHKESIIAALKKAGYTPQPEQPTAVYQ